MLTRSLHGLVVARLVHQVQGFLETNPVGRCYVATGCVFEGSEIVHPDISVLLRENLARARDVIEGAPDWIAEVLDEDDSPFSVTERLNLYRRSGVSEVWIISPRRRAAWVGLLRDAGWEALPRHQARIESRLLNGLGVDIDPLFAP
jgi:Uma2 family endonuclease